MHVQFDLLCNENNIFIGENMKGVPVNLTFRCSRRLILLQTCFISLWFLFFFWSAGFLFFHCPLLQWSRMFHVTADSWTYRCESAVWSARKTQLPSCVYTKFCLKWVERLHRDSDHCWLALTVANVGVPLPPVSVASQSPGAEQPPIVSSQSENRRSHDVTLKPLHTSPNRKARLFFNPSIYIYMNM